MITHDINHVARKRIADDIEAYLAEGGEIKKIPYGHSADLEKRLAAVRQVAQNIKSTGSKSGNKKQPGRGKAISIKPRAR